MKDYFISSIDTIVSSKNNNEIRVYIHDRYDYDFCVMLCFNKAVKDKDIESYVKYMNYPFRDKFYYICSDLFEGERGVYFHLSCDDFDCIVKSRDKVYLNSFIYSINNPKRVSVEMIKDEYDKLSLKIDMEYAKIRSLEKMRNDLIFKYLDRL